MASKVLKRGRKKKVDAVTPTDRSIAHFFTPSNPAENIVKSILNEVVQNCVSPEPEEIVTDILNDVLSTVVNPGELLSKPLAHTGHRVNKKTLSEWAVKYPWLCITGEGNDMKLSCKVCSEQKGKLKLSSVWANAGSLNIQSSSITRHNESSEHKLSCKSAKKSVVETEFEKDDEPECANIKISPEDEKLFNTVYFAAKTELPSDAINGLLSLQLLNGVDIKYKNLSWDSISDMQRSISTVLKDDLVSDIKRSQFYGLMLDESTDVTVEKRLSVCVRYVKSGEPVTRFLCNVPVDDGRSHTIVNSVVESLDKLDLPLSCCTSLATDGASAMTGKHTGVGVQLQSKYAPFCIQTHCVAHRLNLACTDTIKKSEYMVKFRDKFNSLYFFMSASSLRTLALKTIQRILEEPELTVKEPHSIRCLGLRNAVHAVYESYASVIATLSKFAAEKNPVAKGLHKFFNSYKVMLVTAFMLDVHNELAVLSCQLQKQNLLFSEINPLVDGTLAKLDSLDTVDGEALVKMKAKVNVENGEAVFSGEKMAYYSNMDKEFETLRSEYIHKMKKNIKSRFRKKDIHIFDDLSKVLEPEIVNSVNQSASAEAIDHIGTFYGHEKTIQVVHGDLLDGTVEQETKVPRMLDPQQLKEEWPRLQGMIKGAYATLNTSQLCKRILLLHTDLLPNCSILAAIALCQQLTSVECERSFSAQNRLKNKYRASLGSEKLDMLLTISMLGPDVGSDLSPAIMHWLRKKRRKTRLQADYVPRPKKLRLC